MRKLRAEGSVHDGQGAAHHAPEDEHVLEAVQRRLDADPHAMRQRRETVEHPFGTIKARMGATHFLTRTLPKVATEMALAVLAYNFTRVMNIMGVKPLIAAMRELRPATLICRRARRQRTPDRQALRKDDRGTEI